VKGMLEKKLFLDLLAVDKNIDFSLLSVKKSHGLKQ